MRKIKVQGFTVRMLSTEQKGTIDKINSVLVDYKEKRVHPKKCRNGKYTVLEVSRTERIMIDTRSGIMSYCTHEKYNNLLDQR